METPTGRSESFGVGYPHRNGVRAQSRGSGGAVPRRRHRRVRAVHSGAAGVHTVALRLVRSLRVEVDGLAAVVVRLRADVRLGGRTARTDRAGLGEEGLRERFGAQRSV